MGNALILVLRRADQSNDPHRQHRRNKRHTDLTISALPSLVHSGDTTKVDWSATNVASCTVTAPNGDLWNTINSIVGGNTSKPITAATTYTLTCLDLQNQTLTKTATVNILPSFQEL